MQAAINRKGRAAIIMNAGTINGLSSDAVKGATCSKSFMNSSILCSLCLWG